MSASVGPNVTDDGIVFYFDMNNVQKSWQGAPTTNLITQVNSNNTISYARSSGTTATSNQISMPREVLKYSGVKVFADSVSNTSSFWVAYTLGPSVTQNQQIMASWYVYRISGGTTVDFSWGGAHQGNSSNFSVNFATGAITNISIAAGESYAVSAEDAGWYRLACSTTMINGTNCYPQLNFNAGSYAICGAQFEVSNMVNRYLIGSRSNTGTLVDITGNNVITATSLTYNLDGTFRFDGTNNFLRPSINHSYLLSSCLEVWFRSDNHASVGKKTIFGYRHNPGYSSPTIGTLYLEGNVLSASVITSSQVYRTATAATSINTGTWYQAVLNKNTSTGVLQIFVNGQFSGSQTFDTVTYGQWDSPGSYIGADILDIGKSSNTNAGQGWSTDYLTGYISIAKVYNRVLTPTEITRNFQALRRRYNI